MKNVKKFFLLTFGLIFVFKANVEASINIDKSELKNGVVGIEYTAKINKPIKITVEKGSERYIYKVKNNKLSYVPLQMGVGTYKINILEQVEGTKHKSLLAENVDLIAEPPIKMYTYPTFETNFNDSMSSIKNYKTFTKNKSISDKVDSVYKDIINNYYYDFVKMNNVTGDYLPDIEDMYKQKKGICYDYSALLAGVLRSQDIPVKLVKGYSPDVTAYHSWNEVYLNGKWHVVDTTFDASFAQAGQKTKFSKDGTKFKVLFFY